MLEQMIAEAIEQGIGAVQARRIIIESLGGVLKKAAGAGVLGAIGAGAAKAAAAKLGQKATQLGAEAVPKIGAHRLAVRKGASEEIANALKNKEITRTDASEIARNINKSLDDVDHVGEAGGNIIKKALKGVGLVGAAAAGGAGAGLAAKAASGAKKSFEAWEKAGKQKAHELIDKQSKEFEPSDQEYED